MKGKNSIKKVLACCLGLLLPVGVVTGMALSKDNTEVKAADSTLVLDCAKASKEGSQQLYGVASSTVMKNDGLLAFLRKAAGDDTTSSSIISGASVTDSVYWAKGSGGTGIPDDVLKIGKASGPGTINFTLNESVGLVKKVVINGYCWKATTSISVNGSAAQKPTAAATATEFTFDISEPSGSVSIAVTTSCICATEITLTVQPAVVKELTNLEIQGNPAKTSYYVGQSFDRTGLTVLASYSDGSSETLDDSKPSWTISPSTLDAIGDAVEVNVTASYKNINANKKFNVKVLERDAAHTYTSAEGVIESIQGDSLYLEDKVIIDGIEYPAAKAGTSKVAGKMIVTIPENTHMVNVHLASWKGTDATMTILENDITVHGNDGISGNSPYTFVGDAGEYFFQFETNNEEETTLEFVPTNNAYRFVLFGINFEPIDITDLQILGTPKKTLYALNQSFNVEGLSAKVFYNTGDSFDLSDDEVTWDFEPDTFTEVSDAQVVTVTVAYENFISEGRQFTVKVTDKHIHENPTYIEGTDPTCETTGNIGYYKCDCGDCFEDFDCTMPIENLDAWKAGDGCIPALGHIFGGRVTYSWDENRNCTASRLCLREGCDGIESETQHATFIIDTPATCTTNQIGHLEVYFTNSAFEHQVTPKNSYEFPDTKLPHDWNGPVYNWNGDTCTAKIKCSACGEVLTETKKGTYVKDVDATCDSNERGHYVVTFDNTLFGSVASEFATAVKAGSAKGHDYKAVGGLVNKNASHGEILLECLNDSNHKLTLRADVEKVNVPSNGQNKLVYRLTAYYRGVKYSIDIDSGIIVSGNGCGGSIVAASAIITMTSLLGIGLLTFKKRKQD